MHFTYSQLSIIIRGMTNNESARIDESVRIGWNTAGYKITSEKNRRFAPIRFDLSINQTTFIGILSF